MDHVYRIIELTSAEDMAGYLPAHFTKQVKKTTI
jgi:hypothetical protein